MNNNDILKMSMDKKFDVVLMNPPYDNELGNNFLEKTPAMTDKVPEEYWSDPTKTFCEPCFGNGQFVLYIIWNRIQHGIDWETALRTTYGVELMQDNVYETHGRIFKMLSAMGIDFDDDLAFDIMLQNLVCSDFFEWDFDNWCPKTHTKHVK